MNRKAGQGGVLVAGALTVLTAVVFVFAIRLPPRSALVPSIVAGLTLIMLIGQLFGPARTADQKRDPEGAADLEATDLGRPERVLLGWMLTLLALVWAVGIPVALPVFLVAYLRLRSGEPWATAISLGLACWVVLSVGLGEVLEINWPTGVVWSWLVA